MGLAVLSPGLDLLARHDADGGGGRRHVEARRLEARWRADLGDIAGASLVYGYAGTVSFAGTAAALHGHASLGVVFGHALAVIV